MLNTVILSGENENSKTLSQKILRYTPDKLDRKAVNFDALIRQHFIPADYFSFSAGRYQLPYLNQTYYMEYLPEKADLVLPKPQNTNDWVILQYFQSDILENDTISRAPNIKILGNGSRIMGFDESLDCDMVFLSLKLVYIDEALGWIIV
jgi:hypothetical protein